MADSAVEVPSTLWHALSVEDAFMKADSTPGGLTKQEAAARLVKFGKNALTPPKPRSFLKMIWDQLNNIIVFVLIVSTVISCIFQEAQELDALSPYSNAHTMRFIFLCSGLKLDSFSL